MIKTKHFMDRVDADDGRRVWVEPVGLTKDLQEWCWVDGVLSMVGPPSALCAWFEAHPDAYEDFRGRYHEWLAKGPYRSLLEQIAHESLREDITLLHAGDEPDRNCAIALKEFITELEAYCRPDD